MTKSKNTKRALLTSVLSLMLCAAMLIGSTFAWFTDSVTSGKNRIVAGNLDVELWWSKDGADYTKVDAETNMFENALWEPGYTRVVYLKVENAGSLALKYKLGINVDNETPGTNVDGDTFNLSDHIQFGVVNIATPFDSNAAGRAAALAAVAGSAVAISTGYTSEEASLDAGEMSNPIALVVYMPENVGNIANHKTSDDPDNPTAYQPSIDLGIKLNATQDDVESDSFDNQYDKDAYWIETEIIPEVISASQDEVTAAIIAGQNVQITAANNTITLGNNKDIGSQVGIDLNGTTQKIMDSIRAEDGQSLTMINGTVVKETTFGKVRFDTVADSEQAGVFEGVTFTNAKGVSTSGSSSNATDVMIQIVPKNGVGKYIFKNCVFNNACVYINGLAGSALTESDKIEVIFENCIFNNWGNADAIDIDDYGRGTVTITGCTFNMETTSNVSVVSKSNRDINVTVSDSIVNGTKVQPADGIKLYTTQSVTLGDVDTIISVTYQGIATA